MRSLLVALTTVSIVALMSAGCRNGADGDGDSDSDTDGGADGDGDSDADERIGFQYTHDEPYPPTGLRHPSYLLRRPSRWLGPAAALA